MRPLRSLDRPSRWAAALVALSALVLAAAAAGAYRVASVPAGTGRAAPAPDVPALPGSAARDSLVDAAVAAAPFRPDREPPAERYALPGERDGAGPGGRRGPRLRLVGTAVRPGGLRLAAFRTGDGRSRVVEAGGEIEGHRVLRVESGRAVLEGPDSTMVLEVERPADDGGS